MKCVCARALSGCVGLWGLQGCEVGSFSFPDELAGICKRWITRQRESIIQRRKKEKKRNMDPVPVAPGSLFQFRVIFLKCRREERRSSLEGVRAGWWGLENKENEWNCYMCVCPIPPSSPISIHSLSPRSNPKGKAQCENAKGYYQAFRVHKCHLWWMSVGFRKASCQTPAISPP